MKLASIIILEALVAFSVSSQAKFTAQKDSTGFLTITRSDSIALRLTEDSWLIRDGHAILLRWDSVSVAVIDFDLNSGESKRVRIPFGYRQPKFWGLHSKYSLVDTYEAFPKEKRIYAYLKPADSAGIYEIAYGDSVFAKFLYPVDPPHYHEIRSLAFSPRFHCILREWGWLVITNLVSGKRDTIGHQYGVFEGKELNDNWANRVRLLNDSTLLVEREDDSFALCLPSMQRIALPSRIELSRNIGTSTWRHQMYLPFRKWESDTIQIGAIDQRTLLLRAGLWSLPSPVGYTPVDVEVAISSNGVLRLRMGFVSRDLARVQTEQADIDLNDPIPQPHLKLVGPGMPMRVY